MAPTTEVSAGEEAPGLERDRVDSRGVNQKSARKNLPLKRVRIERAFRHRVKQELSQGESAEPEKIRRKLWRKWPESTLATRVEHQRERRARLQRDPRKSEEAGKDGPLASSGGGASLRRVKAMTLPTFGGPEVLTWADVPDPQPARGEVLIDVVATAVNRADIMQRMGHYPPPPGAPEWPGLECSGHISELGEGVTGWSVGDAVCALLSGGGYAERMAAPAGQLFPIPDGLSIVDAAALPEVCCTVWSNVFQAAALRSDETFLVHGGASGIGTMAIQLAARHGARVFCTASTDDKLARCRELGAEGAINYQTEDFVDVVREATDGQGADVILDNMGAGYLQRNVDLLATSGRLIVIGLQGGRRANLDLGTLLYKRASITATSLRFRPAAEKADIVAAVRQNVWPAIESGEVRPVIDRTLPLREAAEAHRVVEASEHIGKVLLVV